MLFIILCGLILIPSNVYAHPHLWAEAFLEINFNDKQEITDITQVWTFDEMFSANLIESEDKNKNGVIDPDEIQSVKNRSFNSLSEVNFYTKVFQNNKLISLSKPVDFLVLNNDGIISYQFKFQLKSPLNPFTNKIDIGIYDTEYFIEFTYADPPLTATGLKEKACPFGVFEDEKHPIYMDLVNPETLKVCR